MSTSIDSIEAGHRGAFDPSERHPWDRYTAERDVALVVIRELAGHVDVRTAQIYVDVSDQRNADGIAALERDPHPLAP